MTENEAIAGLTADKVQANSLAESVASSKAEGALALANLEAAITLTTDGLTDFESNINYAIVTLTEA